MSPLNCEFALHRLPEIERQVKAISYLHGFGRAAAGSLSVNTMAITAHHDYFRVLGQLLAEFVSRARREKIYHFTAL
jgi:hypothetical protein